MVGSPTRYGPPQVVAFARSDRPFNGNLTAGELSPEYPQRMPRERVGKRTRTAGLEWGLEDDEVSVLPQP